jgi:Neprosin
LATAATTIDVGGETDGISSHPAMGSGQFGSAGRGQAAYHRNIYYVASDVTGHQQPQMVSQDPNPTEYNSLVDNTSDWAFALFFGGPGGA